MFSQQKRSKLDNLSELRSLSFHCEKLSARPLLGDSCFTRCQVRYHKFMRSIHQTCRQTPHLYAASAHWIVVEIPEPFCEKIDFLGDIHRKKPMQVLCDVIHFRLKEVDNLPINSRRITVKFRYRASPRLVIIRCGSMPTRRQRSSASFV